MRRYNKHALALKKYHGPRYRVQMAQYTYLRGGGRRARLFTPISLAICISRVFFHGPFVFEAAYHPHKRTVKTHPKQIDPKHAFVHILF